MKKITQVILLVSSLSTYLTAPAFGASLVNDATVSHQLDALNATAQETNALLLQIYVRLSQSAQDSVCWLDGKSFSQGAVTKVSGEDEICGKNPRSWPEWQSLKHLPAR